MGDTVNAHVDPRTGRYVTQASSSDTSADHLRGKAYALTTDEPFRRTIYQWYVTNESTRGIVAYGECETMGEAVALAHKNTEALRATYLLNPEAWTELRPA